MYSFILNIAGYNIKTEIIYDFSLKRCRRYIADDADADFSITMTAEDIAAERAWQKKDQPSRTSDGYIEYLALYRKICEILAKKGVILIHGSCIMVDGKAYLFCAPSGTGKSTHVKLWRDLFGDRAVMINDDKPLIKLDENGVPVICGTPWNGKHDLGENISASLYSICFLERGEQNSVSSLKRSEVLPRLLKFCYRPESAEGTIASLETQDVITSKVRFYCLKCNMDPEAARVAFEGMNA